MLNILITGANGFVGSHILENMMKNNSITVIVACRDKNKLLPEFKGEVREGDLRDDNYVDALLTDIDVICHAAAWSSLLGHKEHSQRLYLQPTQHLIDQAIKKGVQRFIFCSTTSAAPAQSADAFSPGIKKDFWPHLCNVIEIENIMRQRSKEGCQMINLRLGLFAGERYGLGLLPILLPRLKTHLVPWVNSGKTAMPIIDGRDIGKAFMLASLAPDLKNYDAFNIIGPEIPTVREVIEFIHNEYSFPSPHFSVPFFIAYPFAALMESLNSFVPWEPLVTRSIIHLLENTYADNSRAFRKLGYKPEHHWTVAVSTQIELLIKSNDTPMKMAKQIN
jgi:nucleoside-diphosphate-sugar epimerase